jgi:F-type H+-transporting ATPase subunit epsilon
MAEKVAFELVSPERLLISAEVDMVVVPGSEGDFGVLPGHAPLISSVRPGVIRIHDQGEVSERIFIKGGFAEVTPEGCTVLAEEAVLISELDRAGLEQRIEDAGEDLEDAQSDEARHKAEATLALLRQMLEALR